MVIRGADSQSAVPALMRGLVGHALSLLLLLAVTAKAQPEPTFSTATKLVEVDVIAKTKGAPATGLTKDDFILLDNGKPQKIAFFSVRSAQPAGRTAAPLPPGAVSNRFARDGEPLANAAVILLDQRNTPRIHQAFAIQRIVKFIGMRPSHDRIGIYTLLKHGSAEVAQELTDNTELLTRAANGLKPRDPAYRDLDTTDMTAHQTDDLLGLEIHERVEDTSTGLQRIAHHLAKLPGRKSLIWVTTAFPLSDRRLGVDFQPDMEKAVRALTDANVALYPVDARGLIGTLAGMTAISNAETAGPRSVKGLAMSMLPTYPVDPSSRLGEKTLAALTGGLAFVNESNALEDWIKAAVEDGELTWTLGFYPAQERQDGTWHDLKVEVRTRGVQVRYRRNYFAARTADAASAPPTLDQLLGDPLDATQLGILAETTPDSVKVNIDLHDVHLERENARRSGGVDVSFFVEGTGKVLTKTLKIDVPDAQFAALLEKGIDTVESVDTAGGAEAIRIVVQDRATGAAGSVTVPLPKR